jgi:hypothetical protein
MVCVIYTYDFSYGNVRLEIIQKKYQNYVKRIKQQIIFSLIYLGLSSAVFCCLTGRVREATPLAPPREGGRECPSQKLQLRTVPLDGATVLIMATSRELNSKEEKTEILFICRIALIWRSICYYACFTLPFTYLTSLTFTFTFNHNSSPLPDSLESLSGDWQLLAALKYYILVAIASPLCP